MEGGSAMDHRERISEEEAARNLPDLLTRVRDEGASFEITRGSEVMARLAPAQLAKRPISLRELALRIGTG
jgi:antitoxin (DNA-binding transcriptional repressor) of toxin-antitoxin stability system